MNSVQRLLAASVISIQNSCFVYPACQNCFSRLVLDSRRFNCLKCGCTGEAKDASYRYRLSLKIADTNDLFDITVFGGCLDPFFGVTAENLQRYIQDFNQLSGETNTESSTRALAQAVETCFIGKRFIFGVKGCAREDGGHSAASSVLQKCSRINRSTRNLVACQIFLPNAAISGFTVISYLDHLLQSAKFRSCNNSSYLPDGSSAPIDEPLSELSSLSSLSRSSCFVQSSGRESFLGCWQQSFSLTSSVAWVTAEDFPTVEVGKLVSEQHEQEERPVSAELGSVSLNNQTLWDSQFLISSVKEGDKEKGNESSSQLNRTDSISAADKLESVGSSNTKCPHGNSSKLLQHPLESESTPMTKPLQKLRPVGERSSFITIFTPKNPTKILSKCKRSRSSFQNTLLQQLTGKFVKRGRPRKREKASGSSASQQFLNSQLPASLEEWIPPSSNKGLKPTASLNLKTASWAADLQSTCGHTGRNPISESRKNNENDENLIQSERSPGDRASILTIPVSASVTRTSFLNDPVLKTCSPSEAALESMSTPDFCLMTPLGEGSSFHRGFDGALYVSPFGNL
ncbi:DNA damage-induced apoptosis suppressor protein isoform X13 [Turdus rufiventris]|nr:DNA damage-induced apoptosis suppressor protein isoform X13 [Turdus rufiventris]